MKLQRMCISAFSLIELLVVVSIIAVLASLLLVGVQVVRDLAKATACASNLRQIGMAYEAFAIDKNGYYPPAQLRNSNPGMPWVSGGWAAVTREIGDTEFGDNWKTWIAYLTPYVPSDDKEGTGGSIRDQIIFKVFQCATHPRRTQQNTEATRTTPALAIYYNQEAGVSYGPNVAYLDTNASTSGWNVGGYPVGRPGWPGYGIGIPGIHDHVRFRDRIRKASTTIQVAEHLGPSGTNTNRVNWTDAPFARPPVDNQGVAIPIPASFGSWAAGFPLADAFSGHALRVAHRSKSNYLFVDGHVASHTPWETCSADPTLPNFWTGR